MTIVDRYAKKYGLKKKEAKAQIKGFIEILKEALEEEYRAQLNDFGTMKVVTRAAREGRNPSTGETIHVPEKKTVKFTASKKYKETL
jgi:DNA-binding protein HU-beta